MKHQYHPDRALARAALPEILFADDLAIALNINEAKATADLAEGLLGPTITVHGRQAVLRQHFMETLNLRAVLAQRARHAGEGRGDE